MGKTQTPAYVVRSLIQYKMKGKVQYVLVWWKGYRKDEATWEPISNVLTIDLFQQELKEIKERWRKSQAERKDDKRKRENSKNSQPLRQGSIQNKEQSSQEAKVEEDELVSEESLSQKIFKQIGKMPPKSKIIQKPTEKQLGGTRSWLKVKEPKLATPHKGLQNFKDEYISQSKNRKCQFELNNLLDKHAHKQKEEVSNEAKQQNLTNKKEVQRSRPIQRPKQNIQRIKIANKPTKIQIPIGKFIQNGKQRMNLNPLKFQIRIKENKDLPFLDQQLKEIKRAFYKDGELLYEIEFQGNRSTEPIIVHQRYLSLMWPRKYAEYLISKIDTSNL